MSIVPIYTIFDNFCYNIAMNEKVFRDPVHNYIHINHQIIYDLVNTKEFQRLRRIKQVPTTAFTFHGAEHSRFSHCLGVYEIARRVTEIFDEKYPHIWNKEESLLTMTAALLHDIGHGAIRILLKNYSTQTMRLLHKTSSATLTPKLMLF